MMARGGAIWIGLALASAVASFTIQYEMRDLKDELAHLETEIVESRETAHVLRAEWAYLSRPERLAELAHRHLDLEHMIAGQIGLLAEVPLRPEPALDDFSTLLREGSRVSLEFEQP
ncbi:MAG: hypothetical protein GDA49_13220 [Rhodospirillales bacterium]|nr:hypothetical protein [Rhodospirillales bacterium]